MSDSGEMPDGGVDRSPGGRNFLTTLLTFLSALLLFSMMALTFADVVARYFLNSPIYGASEIIAFMLGLTIFTAFPLVTKDRVHITVGIFDNFYKGPVRFVQRLAVLIGTIVFLGLVGLLLWDQGYGMYEVQYLSHYLDVPQAPVVLALAGLTGIAILLFVGVIWRYIRAGGDPEDETNTESLV